MRTGFSLGSNLGDRMRQLCQAKALLLLDPNTTLVGQSAVYETAPVGVQEQYRDMSFLNAVLVVESPYTAEEWLPKIKRVETLLKRVRSGDRNAPRTIDVDLLFSGEQMVDSDLLQVPHPRWSERRFVVEPLADVCPDLVLPGAAGSVVELLARLPETDAVALFAARW